MTEFNLERMKENPDYPKMQEMVKLLIECWDALPAISVVSAKLHNVDLGLDKRIEKCLEPWKVDQ